MSQPWAKMFTIGTIYFPNVLGYISKNRTITQLKRIHSPNALPGKRCYLGIVEWKNKNWAHRYFSRSARRLQSKKKLRQKSIFSGQKHVWQSLDGDTKFNNIVNNFNNFNNFGQENSFSRHKGRPIKGPPKPLNTIECCYVGGVLGDPNFCAPMHIEKSILNLVNSNQIWILISLFQ